MRLMVAKATWSGVASIDRTLLAFFACASQKILFAWRIEMQRRTDKSMNNRWTRRHIEWKRVEASRPEQTYLPFSCCLQSNQRGECAQEGFLSRILAV